MSDRSGRFVRAEQVRQLGEERAGEPLPELYKQEEVQKKHGAVTKRLDTDRGFKQDSRF